MDTFRYERISVSRRMNLIVRDFRQREQGGTDRKAIPLDRIHGDCEPQRRLLNTSDRRLPSTPLTKTRQDFKSGNSLIRRARTSRLLIVFPRRISSRRFQKGRA
jgi:hypothetical protein